MEPSREIKGSEFDWFASDGAGQFALFATSGHGPIPATVREAIAAHDSIGDTLEVTGWGSSEVWQSYSRLGLFAYDWSDTIGAYIRVAEPIFPPSRALLGKLSACPGLPALARLVFSQVTVIRPDWKDGT